MAAGDVDVLPDTGSCYLQTFDLYETRSKFYMVGSDKSRTLWRVLKIDRSETSELDIREDSTTYSEIECNELLKRIDEGNKSTGGLNFVTNCYGIVGFIKFLGPYYMLLITGRQQIGAICGHTVYAVTKSEMIPLSNSDAQSDISNSRDENRYKKLLRTMDLTKGFFFSYSYHIMQSLQKNLCDYDSGQVLYETMFVWNEFLTREIRDYLKNTLWTVALVYGFFKQDKLSILGKDFRLTLIARRSRHYAGTRYLKRGVNEEGRVANDVETEQIVFEDTPGEVPTQISSIVQNRGSIPLFWSQETSRLNLKPDIVLQRDKNFEATQLHFENLVNRYGNPVIILNLIKTREKKPRESILRAEFANAIHFINKDISEENHLRFLHWDLNKHSRSKGTNVLSLLGKIAAYALNLTGFCYCQLSPALTHDGALKWPAPLCQGFESRKQLLHLQGKTANIRKEEVSDCSCDIHNNKNNGDVIGIAGNGFQKLDSSATSGHGFLDNKIDNSEICSVKQHMFQKGVLRTNCIDCLDRTNVAQYAYGLAALGHQLHVLGLVNIPKIDPDAALADELMSFYETMGDTLALQYGGSAAHNKVFSQRRGQWKATTQSQEFFRTLQRYYNNAYMDAEKQDAINLFLGDFQPQLDKPAIWNVGRNSHGFSGENERLYMKRSLSDGNILRENNTPVSRCNIGQKKDPKSAMTDSAQRVGDAKGLSDSTPEISTCESDISYSRYTPMMSRRQIFDESEHIYFNGHGYDSSNCSNFLDLDWLSSSGNSCEEEIYERSTQASSSVQNLSTNSVINGMTAEMNPSLCENGSNIKGRGTAEVQLPHGLEIPNEFSDSFANWVIHGEALCH